MKRLPISYLRFTTAWWLATSAVLAAASLTHNGQVVVHTGQGSRGGELTVAQRSEPKTLNPVIALDQPSREVIGRMQADLMSTNPRSRQTELALAESWNVSADGRQYLVRLRRGLQFSDGSPFDSDDVVFSFRVYLDERVHARQRDLLLIHEQPIHVTKLDEVTVKFNLPAARGDFERLFDSLPMLPRHLLEKAYLEGKIESAWGLSSKPEQIAGMGPFRLKTYQPGQQMTLERNPYYWKSDDRGQRLPYLDGLRFTFAGSEDGQLARFLSGDADVINRIGSKSFALLKSSPEGTGPSVTDLGPGFEYTVLGFNFGKKEFTDQALRRAISAAIDRDAIVRIAYTGRASAVWGNVTPSNKLWLNTNLRPPVCSEGEARKILSKAGFRWDRDGKLLDRSGVAVKFSIITATNNSERLQTATLIQADLARIGMDVQIVPLEFRALVDRVTRSRDFEACILSFGGADGDPDSEMNLWLSSGSMHVWDPEQSRPATTWEGQIDDLMREQIGLSDQRKRKELYDQVQQILADQQPMVFLVSPHVLVAARKRVVNFAPAVLESYTLWNADRLAVANASGGER